MQIPSLAIKNFRFTLLAMFLLVLMGFHSFMTMPRYEDPQFGAPGLVMYFIYPGASPEDVEAQVINPVEDVMREIRDLDHVIGTSLEGVGVVGMKYDYGVDHGEKYNEIVREINSIRDDLPDELVDIRFEKITTEGINIYQFALISESADMSALEQRAEDLAEKLEKIDGILQADVFGVPERAVEVQLRPEQLALRNISISQVAGAIISNNEVIPGGNMDIGSRSFSVSANSTFERLDDVAEVHVSGFGNKLVQLKDLAEVRFDYEETDYLTRYSGRRCVFITAQQQIGSNIKPLSEAVSALLEKERGRLSAGMELQTVFDQSVSVRSRTRTFFLNLFSGVLLVGLIISLLVGFRASLIIMMAVPISIVIGIGMVDMSDFGLQQITIAGLIVALGLLVDNAIVVTENVARFIELGYSPMEAAKKGAGQVGWPIVSSTATTILAFLPLTSIQDASGDFIKSLPVTVIYTIAASLLVALTLTPYIASLLFKKNSFSKKNAVQRWLDHFIQNGYTNSLSFVLRNKGITMIGAAALFAFSLYVFGQVGVSFFPSAEKPILMIDINSPYGSNMAYTDSFARKLEAVLDAEEFVKGYATNVGQGNPKIYYNHFPAENAPDHAQIYTLLEAYEEGKVNRLKESLRDTFARYPGVKVRVREFEQGPPTDYPISIRLKGDNLDELKRIALDVEEIFYDIPGLRDIENDSRRSISSLEVKMDKPKAAMLGVSASEVNRVIRAAVDGIHISDYHDPDGERYDIRLRLLPEEGRQPDVFEQLYVSSLSGAQLPLEQVASIEFKSTPYVISHYNFDRIERINANAEAGYNVNSLTNEILKELKKYPFPEGYGYIVAGEKEKLSQSLRGIGIAAAIAIIGIFSVLVMQFRSFAQPLIIYSALPFAVIGSVFTLLMLGLNFSFTAMVGLTSLIGIVVNDSIILIDFANQSRREGKSKLDSIMEAGQVRFIPIILTTLTTVGGLLPLTLRGGTLWAPMGWVIIGGLTVSTFLILYIVPVLYMVYSPKTTD